MSKFAPHIPVGHHSFSRGNTLKYTDGHGLMTDADGNDICPECKEKVDRKTNEITHTHVDGKPCRHTGERHYLQKKVKKGGKRKSSRKTRKSRKNRRKSSRRGRNFVR